MTGHKRTSTTYVMKRTGRFTRQHLSWCESQSPMQRSTLIKAAVNKVIEDPTLLGRTLSWRLDKPTSPLNDKSTSYSCNNALSLAIDKVADMAKLSGDEVVRLAMDAYIHGVK